MKERLDLLLHSRGLAESREKARALIMEGNVYVSGKRADKAGMQVEPTAEITVLSEEPPFVSRGGQKLDKAIRSFPIQLDGKVCADIGASTGGFTDCMLQNGARRVYALDVGYGQLHWKLRTDERVHVMERRNARFMEPNWFGEALDFASIDVSFISLRLILPPLLPCLSDGGEVVALIKPQFEAGRGEVGKKGVVRERDTHVRVLREMIFFAAGAGYQVAGLSFSPITGPRGNIEFLLYLRKNAPIGEYAGSDWEEIIETVVDASHTICI